jgi:uncharacterized protein (UPF0212 family)
MIDMVWSWQYVATFVERDYGSYVDWDEEFFECPECGEPIYKCDYPMISLGMICPVCEAMIEEE